MKILVIGDSCLDVFVKCDVNRLSPEAPVPVANPTSESSCLGMAGNVYENLKTLGNNDTIFITNENSISKKTRYVDSISGYILIRIDKYDTTKERLTLSRIKNRLEQLSIIPESIDCILISDYNKGLLSEENLKDIINYFSSLGVTTMMDTKKILGEWSKNVDFVKINNKEYLEQCRHLKNPILYCKNMIVTLGGLGSEWINKNITSLGRNIKVRDVSGAGDTYFAAFALKYLELKDVVESMIYANKAAAVAVSKHGVVAVNKREIV